MADGIEDGLGLTQATFLVLPGPSHPSPVGDGDGDGGVNWLMNQV